MACLRCAIMRLLVWVEDVELSEGALIVSHSYPEGITISHYIKPFLVERLPSNVRLEVIYRRVEPGSLRYAKERSCTRI